MHAKPPIQNEYAQQKETPIQEEKPFHPVNPLYTTPRKDEALMKRQKNKPYTLRGVNKNSTKKKRK